MKKMLMFMVCVSCGLNLRADSTAEIKTQESPVTAVALTEGPVLGTDVADPGSRGRVVAGTSAYLVQPFFQNNPAIYFVRAQRVGTSGTNFVVNDVQGQTDAKHSVDVAPEFYLGYVSESGLGMRVRYWMFRQGTSQSVSTPAVTDPTLSFAVSSAAPIGLDIDTRDNGLPDYMNVTTKLHVQVMDFIATQEVDTNLWSFVLGGGVRYAHVAQRYDAYETQQPGTTFDFRENPPPQQTITAHRKTLESGSSFNGWGPVVQVDSRRHLGQSNLALIGNLRGSVLFGNGKQNAFKTLFVRGTQEGEILSETAYVERSNQRNAVLGIVEAELGVEYGRDVRAGRAFGQVALVGQQWINGGSASRSATTGAGFGLPGSGQTGAPQVAGTTSDTDFGFLGLAFRLGLNY